MAKNAKGKSNEIDFTENKVSTPVKKYVDRIRGIVKRKLKNSNIPIFMEMSNDKDVLAHYFMNRKDYLGLIGGSNMAMLDRVVRLSIAQCVVNDVSLAMESKSGVVYPGIWDEFSLMTLAMSVIGIGTIENNPEKGYFLVCGHQDDLRKEGGVTEEDAESYDIGTWVPFEDYNPNVITQYCLLIQSILIGMIRSEITSVIPAALSCSANESTYSRYARELKEILTPGITKWKERDKAETTTLDEEANAFIDAVETGLVGYLVVLLSESGLSKEAIELALRVSKAKVFYTSDAEDDSEINSFVDRRMNFIYTLNYTYHGVNGEEVFGTAITLKPYDIVAVVDSKADTAKNAKAHLGKAFRKFIDSSMLYVTNIYLREKGNPISDEAD